jgi:hypothetical protein
MSRVATYATILAVGLLVVVAAIDALRGGGGAPGTTRPVLDAQPALVRGLTNLGARGRLVYTDARCTVRALALPSLRETARPAALDPACAFSLSPDGRRASSPGADWSPDGRLVAVCRGTIVGVWVRRERGTAQQEWDGCSPAWRPDGVLTLVREGELLEVRPGCAGPPPCERVLLGRAVLRQAATRHPTARNAPGLVSEPEVEDVVWLSRSRVAVLLGVRFGGRLAPESPLDLLAVFAGRRVIATNGGLDDHLTALLRSPRGRYVATRPDRLFRSDASRIFLPASLVGVKALAFSPDERLLVVATRSNLVVLDLSALARGSTSRGLRIPVVAQGVDWR